MPGVADFEEALRALFVDARQHGYVSVRAGNLHREVAGSSEVAGVNTCCGVMWAATTAGACRVLHTPPGGIGGDLEICYALPRPSRLWDRRYGRY